MESLASTNVEQKWDHLRTVMEAARCPLERQGFITRKSNKPKSEYWVIRYRETVESKTRLRSIYIGADTELVARARQLLGTWQSAAHPERSPIPGAQQSWETLLDHAKSMSRGHRRLFIEALRPVAGDPLQLLATVRRWPGVLQAHQRSRRPGRPLRGRLVVPS